MPGDGIESLTSFSPWAGTCKVPFAHRRSFSVLEWCKLRLGSGPFVAGWAGGLFSLSGCTGVAGLLETVLGEAVPPYGGGLSSIVLL